MYELVTIEELEEQVWNIEGVRIKVRKQNSEYPDRLVKPYNFERLSDDATVDDLKDRINSCLNFSYIIQLNHREE